MTTPTSSPPPPGAPPAQRQPAAPTSAGLNRSASSAIDAATSRTALGSRSGSGSNTVGFLQRWNLIIPVMIALTGLAAVVGSFVVQTAARATDEATGPALIEVQDLFASVAEANTAATAAHLAVDVTGSENRASRNLYDDALRRSHQHLARVAADIGQDPAAQVELQSLGAALAVYSGEVEAARLAKLNGLDEADSRLRGALDILNTEIGPSVASLTNLGQNRYDSETAEGRLFIGIALAAGLVTLAAMIWMQVKLAHRTRRVLNPLLALSTLAVIALVGLLLYGNALRVISLNDADAGGYDAISSTAELQNSTFGLQSNLALLLLDESGSGGSREVIVDDLLVTGTDQIQQLVDEADSVRESAAAQTLVTRWNRYVDMVNLIRQTDSRGDRIAAVALFQGEGVSTFNGVNTAIESVLVDNRDQFSDGVDTASSAVELNPWICLLLTVAGGLLAIVAIQRRLGDYR